MKHDSIEFEVDRVTFLVRLKRFIIDIRMAKPKGLIRCVDFMPNEVPPELQKAMAAWLSDVASSDPVIKELK